MSMPKNCAALPYTLVPKNSHWSLSRRDIPLKLIHWEDAMAEIFEEYL